MASAAVTSILTQSSSPSLNIRGFPVPPADQKKHHVQTTLNYYKDLDDGLPPAPSYVGRPETYYRENEPLDVTITDISGNELDYTLDGNGFQIYYHESKEKDFLDEEKIETEYYSETEQLLKDA
jgi:hypothetical protein